MHQIREAAKKTRIKYILFKTTCRNIDISVLAYCVQLSNEKLTVFTDFLKYLPKNMALLAQKLWRNFFCQNPFPAILRRKKKKVPNDH